MSIIISTLYRDMLNFFHNQFNNILLLAMLTAAISVMLGHALSPEKEQLIKLKNVTYINETTEINLQQLIQKLSIEQRYVLIKASAANILGNLVGNSLLVGGLINMIRFVSNRHPINVLRVIKLSTLLLPRLLLIIFLTMLTVQLGMILIIIPGILLSIAFSLAPIIAINANLSAIKSMQLSISLSFTNFWLIAPAILLWLLAKNIILLLAIHLKRMHPLITPILLNSATNLISAMLLIYLYRLYMLLCEPDN